MYLKIVLTGTLADTNQIRAWPLERQGQRIFLIDTPGVNETEFNETEFTETGFRRWEYENLEEWLGNQGRVDQKGVELDGIVFLLSIAENPRPHPWISLLILMERLCKEKPLSRVIVATTGWDFVGYTKGLWRESEFKLKTRHVSETRFHDSDWIRLAHTGLDSLATLDKLLQQINSDIQDRSVEETATHQGEINASKQKTSSSKNAQASDEAEEKRHRSAATKHEEEITALKQQILDLEKANQALKAENEHSHAALAASTTQAAATQEALTTALNERTKELTAIKAYVAEAERTATGYWGNVDIPPIPYSLEPPRQAND